MDYNMDCFKMAAVMLGISVEKLPPKLTAMLRNVQRNIRQVKPGALRSSQVTALIVEIWRQSQDG